MAEGNMGQGAQLQCGICFEKCPADSLMSASLPADVASSSQAAGRCSHKYCAPCMQQYVGCELQTRKLPIRCPSPECDEEISTADVLQLLGGQPHLMQLYQTLEAEAIIDSNNRVYCPFKDCSVLLEGPEGEEGDPASGQQEAPFECPVCHRGFCLSCGITGWHEGMSCKQFQELPANLRSAEDAAMLQVAKQQQWKQCPSCRHMVERTQGNHMRCRCGGAFCYACGVRYNTSADDEQDTPACACGLFEVPAEVRQPANRPWRNGRRVSLTPCRHATSIHDCPNGPGRCWFWHLEDDERAISEDGDSSSSSGEEASEDGDSSSSGAESGEGGDTKDSSGEGSSEDGDTNDSSGEESSEDHDSPGRAVGRALFSCALRKLVTSVVRHCSPTKMTYC